MTKLFFEEREDQSEVKARIVQKYFDAWANIVVGTAKTCLSLLIRFRGQNRRGINKLTTLALAVETTPQRVDDIGLSGPPPDLRG